MGKVAFFFDGFNLYHALDSKTFYHKYKWLDLRSLAEKFVTKQDNIEHVLYFTALSPLKIIWGTAGLTQE